MTDETDTTSEVARVLRAHEWRTESGGVRCRCRALLPTVTEYHDHQAAMLAEAGLLRESAPTPDPDCPCAACDPGTSLGGLRFASRMSVCPDCGNKRCPKAANHARWQCGGSNAVGQVGVPVETKEATDA